MLCPRHNINLTKKPKFKTKKFKAKVINEQIEQMCANMMIAELDLLFTNKPEQCHFTTAMFAQTKYRNVK